MELASTPSATRAPVRPALCNSSNVVSISNDLSGASFSPGRTFCDEAEAGMGAGMDACAGESCSFTATNRQIEVLVLLANGLRDSEIAEELRISLHTVAHHVKTLQRKLAASNRPSLIALAIAAGIIDASMWPVISTNMHCALVRPNRCPLTGSEAD